MTEGEKATYASAEQTARVSRGLWFASIGALVVTVLVGVATASTVPWETTISYARVSRSFDLPMFVLVAVPLLLGIFVVKNRTPETKSIRMTEYRLLFVVIPLFLALCIVGQVVLATTFVQAAA